MKIMNVRDFDIPEFKRKKCGLWDMVRYFDIIRMEDINKFIHITDDLKKQTDNLEDAIENARRLLEEYKISAEIDLEPMYKINLNDLVKVRLTDKGKEIFTDYYKQYSKYCDGPYEPKVDEKGFTELQIHQIANIFGPYLVNGCPYQVIFNNAVYLNPKDVKKVAV